LDVLAALVLIPVGGNGDTPFVGALGGLFVPGTRRCLPWSIALGLVPVGMAQRRGLEVGLAPTPGTTPAIEHDFVGFAGIPSPNEARLARGTYLLARTHVDERERPRVVDGRAEVDRQPRGAQAPPEPHGLVEQTPAIDLRAPRGLHDRWIVTRLHGMTLPRTPDAVTDAGTSLSTAAPATPTHWAATRRPH